MTRLEGTLRSGRLCRQLVRRFRQVIGNRERGDVPGWVMIAVMTAALVVAILVPFRNTIIPAMTGAIQDMFGQAQ